MAYSDEFIIHLEELAHIYIEECLNHKKEMISNKGDIVMVLDRHIPTIDYLIVAGGGAAAGIGDQGFSWYLGGGGAGGVLSGSAELSASINYTVNVGLGGSNVSGALSPYWSGESSSFLGYTAIGGGGAGYNNGSGTDVSPQNGGSGGGGKPSGGTGIPGQGTNGQGTANWNGGGLNIIWFDGIQYALGGEGGAAISQVPFAYNGFGANGVSRPSNQPYDGNPGTVVIRYFNNEPLATGGLITSASGHIYHTFTSSANFTFDANKVTIL
jgi:hypothetical protein